jgi:tRNA 2-selenouridine synthase
MVRTLRVDEWLTGTVPVIDVRSPGEFARGHIPGAVNVPLFTDAERAVVGTLYKQQGRDKAVLEGLRIVGPKLAAIVEQARALAPDGRIRVHCWRGGERSGSVAWLLDKAGFDQVHALKGGYKAFRGHVLAELERPVPLRVLGGYTGSGKTELLNTMRRAGARVIDLEGLAHHKGSSFGAIGQAPQPTTEHFENLLWHALHQLGTGAPIWVEDESRTIGRSHLPDAFYQSIRRAPLYFVDIPVEERVQRLVAEYGNAPKEQLAEAIVRIRKRLGPQHAKAALEALDAGDLVTVATIALTYYDRAYRHDMADRDPAQVHRIKTQADRSLHETLLHIDD